jgi:hypothetical protein
MLTPDEAEQMYAGLSSILLEERFGARFDRMLSEVQQSIALGRPEGAEILSVAAPGRRRSRERVRSVQPFDPVERLGILVRAIELEIITPIDLLAATLDRLSLGDSDGLGVAFIADAAGTEDAASVADVRDRVRRQRSGEPEPPLTGAIYRRDVAEAEEIIEPLRAALAAILREIQG